MLNAHDIIMIMIIGFFLAVGAIAGIGVLGITAFCIKWLSEGWCRKHKRKGLRKL